MEQPERRWEKREEKAGQTSCLGSANSINRSADVGRCSDQLIESICDPSECSLEEHYEGQDLIIKSQCPG